MHTTLQKVFDKVGIKCPSIFIAGGAAVDVDLASDIDIWFGGGRRDLAHNFLYGFPVRFAMEEGSYGSADMVGTGWDPEIGKPVQVLVTEHKGSAEVLAEFDISTHMHAWDGLEKWTQGAKATFTGEAPKILKVNNKTLERYIKICKRYGHVVDMEELMKCNSSMEKLEIGSHKTEVAAFKGDWGSLIATTKSFWTFNSPVYITDNVFYQATSPSEEPTVDSTDDYDDDTMPF